MPNVIIRRYNTFFDHRTNVQFNPVLDRVTGLYIGLARITDAQVPQFSGNPAYEILTDAMLEVLTKGVGNDDDQAAADVQDKEGLTSMVSMKQPKPK